MIKLISCHIENFGKLQNFDFEFTKGLNTIKEENGFGKTTFANFIKFFLILFTPKLSLFQQEFFKMLLSIISYTALAEISCNLFIY